MDVIDKLALIFKEFPGIGERQARRFVYFLMSRTPAYASNLSSLILELKKDIAQCRECFRFFLHQKSSAEDICDICASNATDASTLLVVEKDSDLESVRKSRTYQGKYFILGGLVPIVEKTTRDHVRIEELKKKIAREKNNGLSEVILAFSISPQGDHTDMYVRQELEDVANKSNIKISSLGKGLSTGTELEYSDSDTLKNALKNRQ